MPTKPPNKTFKIRITPERVLGPLDFERVRALVMKGRIMGQEPTSVEPFTSWSTFASFPELAELLLKKLEADSGKKKQASAQPEALPATKTIVQPEPDPERTKTIVADPHAEE